MSRLEEEQALTTLSVDPKRETRAAAARSTIPNHDLVALFEQMSAFDPKRTSGQAHFCFVPSRSLLNFTLVR
jgi:hypothetical protein